MLFGLFEQPSAPLFLLTIPEILWEASLALDHQHLGVIEPDDLVLLGLDRRHDVAHPVTTAHPLGPDCAFS